MLIRHICHMSKARRLVEEDEFSLGPESQCFEIFESFEDLDSKFEQMKVRILTFKEMKVQILKSNK